jgi:hypothetical protein
MLQGLITVEGNRQVMVQGVQETYDTYPLDREAETSDTTLVLIGKNLDRDRLQREFSTLLSSALCD